MSTNKYLEVDDHRHHPSPPHLVRSSQINTIGLSRYADASCAEILRGCQPFEASGPVSSQIFAKVSSESVAVGIGGELAVETDYGAGEHRSNLNLSEAAEEGASVPFRVPQLQNLFDAEASAAGLYPEVPEFLSSGSRHAETEGQRKDGRKRKSEEERDQFWAQRPEWLPEGWKMEVKKRTNGLTAGTRDRYYFDPKTGHRFRSRKQVQEFLKTGEIPQPKRGLKQAQHKHTGPSPGDNKEVSSAPHISSDYNNTLETNEQISYKSTRKKRRAKGGERNEDAQKKSTPKKALNKKSEPQQSETENGEADKGGAETGKKRGKMRKSRGGKTPLQSEKGNGEADEGGAEAGKKCRKMRKSRGGKTPQPKFETPGQKRDSSSRRKEDPEVSRALCEQHGREICRRFLAKLRREISEQEMTKRQIQAQSSPDEDLFRAQQRESPLRSPELSNAEGIEEGSLGHPPQNTTSAAEEEKPRRRTRRPTWQEGFVM